MPSVIGQRTGICGFLAPEGCGDAADRLKRLSEGLTAIGGEAKGALPSDGRKQSEPRCGVLALPGFETADVAARDGWTTAIRGLPRWIDTELSRLARRSGHAVALLEGYRQFGPDVLNYLEGSFLVVVLNADHGDALLAVDRMGIETLCWAETSSGELVFASSALGVKTYPGVDAGLSGQALYDFLFFYLVPGPQTIFRGISKLRPGHRLLFAGGRAGGERARTEPYWRMPYASADVSQVGHGSQEDILLTELEGAVRRSLTGLKPESTGTFLSGGLDSSTVLGLVQKVWGSARSFTIGFPEARYDETSYAKLAAKHFNADYNELILTAMEAVDILPKLATAFDEPFANSSAIPSYFCARLARDMGCDVLIAGDGGDELFAGNERYASMRRYDVYGHIPEFVRRGGLDATLSLPFWTGVPVMGKAQRLMQRFNMPLAQRVYSGQLYSFVSDADIFNPDFLRKIDRSGPERRVEAALERHQSHDDIQTLMGLDLTLTLADNDLRKVTKACHLAGTGVRFPLLDDGLVRTAASMPSSLLMPSGELRSFFKSALRGFLPDQTLTKEKHGFGAPQDAWARSEDAIRDFYETSIRKSADLGVLSDQFIDRLVNACQPGSNDPVISSAYDVMILQQWFAAHG